MSFRSNFVHNLPEDPAEAIAELADRAQEWMKQGSSPDDAVNTIYISAIFERFISRYDLGLKVINTSGDSTPSLNDYLEAVAKFSARRTADKLIDNYDAQTGHLSLGMARLNSDEKDEIHEHLSAIRGIVESSPLDNRKKNALFDRIARLSEEVDKAGTRTDRFFAFAGDAAFVLGDMADKAKPFLSEVREIIKIISRSRARTEGVSLPDGEEVLTLPSPDSDN